MSPKIRKLQSLLQEHVPTRSEIRLCLGSSLANVFFQYGHQKEKELLCLAAEKNGSRRQTRDSTVDQSNIVVNETEMIKACTHQDILDLGVSLLEDFRREVQEDVRTRFETEFLDRRMMLEAEKRVGRQLMKKECQEEYDKRIDLLKEEMEEKSKKDVEALTEKNKKEVQKAVVQERLNTTREMLRKMRQEVCYIVTSLYDEFEKSNLAAKTNMIADFNEISRRDRRKSIAKRKELERRAAEACRVEKQILETQHVADIINIFCTERLRCSTAKRALHKEFQTQIRTLENLAADLVKMLTAMEEKSQRLLRDKKSLQTRLCKVVREFDKFINYVFDALPGQTDFLLPMDSFLCDVVKSRHENEEEEKSEDFRPSSSKKQSSSDSVLQNETRLRVCSCTKRTEDWSTVSVKSLKTFESLSFCSGFGSNEHVQCLY